MSDNTSVIDAVRLIAKATKEDTTKVSDIVKGALHADQIDDMRLMLSKARDGSVTHGAAASSAAASAPAATAKASTARAATLSRETSVQRRAWKGGANKASAKFQGIPPSPSEGHFSPLTAATTTWRQAANRAPTRKGRVSAYILALVCMPSLPLCRHSWPGQADPGFKAK